MKSIDSSLVEIRQNDEAGYKPLVYYEGWRVAILNDADKFRREHTTYMERHDQTDEVFVLLAGTASLYIGDGGDDSPGHITLLPMEPKKIYNVKKGVWHCHVSTPDAAILIVENADTAKTNSHYIAVTPDMLPAQE
jgi:ureidoglycolate hydrolase